MGLQQILIAEDTPLANFGRELKVFRAMELLSRSRSYVIQNNSGLARKDVEAARQTLKDIQEKALPDQKQIIALWLQRLDLVLANINDSPVIAANDLEIAWTLLAAGFSPSLQMETLPVDLTQTPEVIEKAVTPSPTAPTLMP